MEDGERATQRGEGGRRCADRRAIATILHTSPPPTDTTALLQEQPPHTNRHAYTYAYAYAHAYASAGARARAWTPHAFTLLRRPAMRFLSLAESVTFSGE